MAVGSSRKRFSTYSWLVLAYVLFVILFGAWVRITGSGAGCGSHWPTCHGELVPPSASIETLIEFTHRATSGLLGPLVLFQVVWAWRLRPAVSKGLVAAVFVLLFVVLEALIGAGLVLAELVADDDSIARVIVVALHLGNTLVLTAAGALVPWFAMHDDASGAFDARTSRTPLVWGLVGLVLVSMTGAVTALGDTLFPVSRVAGGGFFAPLAANLSAGGQLLVQLRVIHPILAVAVGAHLAFAASRWVQRSELAESTQNLARWLLTAVCTQLLAGVVNIALAAPGWMQLLHLLLGQVVWILTVVLFVEAGQRRISAPQRVGL